MKWWFICAIVFGDLMIIAQNANHFNIVIGLGPSYFFNDKTLRRRVDNTRSIGVNYTINNKTQNLKFSPGIGFVINEYHSRLSNSGLVNVSQRLLGLNADVLMKIRKKILIRVGLFFNKVGYSSIFISRTNYNSRGYFGYGNDQLYKNYSEASIQAGFTLGCSFLFKLFKREQKFNIKFVQQASPLVDSDFNLSKTLVGEDVKVLSHKARATMLVLGFDFSLKRVKKKKEGEE